MGNKSSKKSKKGRSKTYEAEDNQSNNNNNNNNNKKAEKEDLNFRTFRDKYETIEQVQDGLRECGLESSNLVIGIDYTISNRDQGKISFNGQSLHAIDSANPNARNPYQQVISIVGKTLEAFDDDKLIPVFGFGDSNTSDKSVFPLSEDIVCHGFEQVLARYSELTPTIKLAGPTSFAPLIREAINIVKREKGYHILVIIADGQVTGDSEYCKAESETRQAIVDASNYPISIITVGVGDGPWERMEEFDDELPQRKFDNFQFVPFYTTMSGCPPQFQEVNFALAALQEIPDQYKAIKRLGLLNF